MPTTMRTSEHYNTNVQFSWCEENFKERQLTSHNIIINPCYTPLWKEPAPPTGRTTLVLILLTNPFAQPLHLNTLKSEALQNVSLCVSKQSPSNKNDTHRTVHYYYYYITITSLHTYIGIHKICIAGLPCKTNTWASMFHTTKIF